jgi:hypothetical protein
MLEKSMYANSMTANEKVDRYLSRDRAEAIGLYGSRMGEARYTGHDTDRLHSATLIERVLGFMDRYNQSTEGQR